MTMRRRKVLAKTMLMIVIWLMWQGGNGRTTSPRRGLVSFTPRAHPAPGCALFGEAFNYCKIVSSGAPKIFSQFYNSKLAPSKAAPKAAHVHRGQEQGEGFP